MHSSDAYTASFRGVGEGFGKRWVDEQTPEHVAHFQMRGDGQCNHRDQLGRVLSK